jgi:anti-sigma regulatory factor (Ser/Thr protein kinase)
MTERLLGIITFPGRAGEVAIARHYVRDLLAGNGHRIVAGDAELLTSECVTNAIRFTRSGAEGGRVAVTVLDLRDAVRVEVLDQGGATTVPAPRGVPDSDSAVNGRGLHLVRALAKEWGTTPNDMGTTTWFVL